MVVLAALPAYAYSPTAYPGAIWTDTGRECNGVEGTYSQGFVRQGIEWTRINNSIGIQTYAKIGWRFRGIDKDYFNAYIPGAGVMFSWRDFDLGLEFSWPYYTERHEELKSNDVFFTWFRYVDLIDWDSGRLIKALPFTTWGSLAYDLLNQDGSSTLGWVKVEADFLLLPKNFRAGVYAAYNWRLRTRNDYYYNMHGPSAGVSVGNGVMSVGAEYALSSYTEKRTDTKSLNMYFRMFQPWDLK